MSEELKGLSELKLLQIKLHQMFCQHCKAMQKSSGMQIECLYSPVIDGHEYAFCASSCDVVHSLTNMLAQEGYGKMVMPDCKYVTCFRVHPEPVFEPIKIEE